MRVLVHGVALARAAGHVPLIVQGVTTAAAAGFVAIRITAAVAALTAAGLVLVSALAVTPIRWIPRNAPGVRVAGA
jgi:hypothetical protein